MSRMGCREEWMYSRSRTPSAINRARRLVIMGLSELTAVTAETCGCSRRNARDVVCAAHKDWLNCCYGSEEIDQKDLLFQQVGRLERIARKAENSGQFSAAVGAITALNRMMALGADQRGFRGHRPNGHYYRR